MSPPTSPSKRPVRSGPEAPTAPGATAAPGATVAVGGPAGLVTLIVGEVGRSSSSRARSRPAGPQEGKRPLQWSTRWSAGGPEQPSTGSDAEPDLTLTIGTDDAGRVQQGDLQPSVAFMQGKLKSTGDNALLLRILAWSATPAFADTLKEWTAEHPG
jgi:SCP-2 sterol transfer family